MKVRSDSLPQNDFEINNIVGNECDVVFFDVENHTEEKDENGNISYEYDAYTIKTTYRSNLGADISDNYEKWYNYVVNEMVPTIRHIAGLANGYDQGILTFGASMGAMHAANLYYRRPDLFDSCFAISGLYDNEEFFGGYCDNLVYNNCPCLYLANMPQDHYYMDLYRSQKSLVVCGQGAWEEPLLESTRWLDTVCRSKGIPTRFEYWGYDVNHDWPWWFKMVKTYLPWLLD